MSGTILVCALAVVTEAIVQYAKEIGKAIGAREWKRVITQAMALVIGIMLCLASGADLFAASGIALQLPYVGIVLTGIIISRGANYVSDLVGRLEQK